MDHLSAVLNGNLDDLVASKVGANRSVLATLADDIGLIGLCAQISVSHSQGTSECLGLAHTLPVHRETVLIAANC